MKLLIFTLLPLAITCLRTQLGNPLNDEKSLKLSQLSSPQGFSPVNNNSLLQPLLIPRPPGSANIQRIRKHLVDYFTRNLPNWTIEKDTFNASTPIGVVEMTNLIFTRDIGALRKVVVACHYDSKREPEGFVGATDSAGPMSIMLSIAKTMEALMVKSGSSLPSHTLQLIFFDGEEAMEQWTATDSLYGSRNLKSAWAKPNSSVVSAETMRYWAVKTPYANRLEEMELMILLDLLGSRKPWPRFYSYHSNTAPLHQHLFDIEQNLYRLILLSKYRQKSKLPYFVQPGDEASAGIMPVQDDHVPFLESNIPVLHWIPQPFPDVWHTEDDDETAISEELLNDFSLILGAFLVRYLDLECAL